MRRAHPLSRWVWLAVGALGLGVAPRAGAQEQWRPWVPSLDSITVAGDSIFLWKGRVLPDSIEGYVLVRPGSDWRRVRRIASSFDPPSGRGKDSIVVPLEDGARLVTYGERHSYGVAQGARIEWRDGRAVAIAAALPDSDRAALAGTGRGDAVYPMATTVTAVASSPRAWWLGLDGGFVEGDGAIGALLRVDRASGHVTTVVHDWLTPATITSIVPVGDTLFIGTEIPVEGEPSGWVGLIAYEPARDRWRSVGASETTFVNDRILTMARVGDTLIVSTAEGPALRSIHGGRWTSWRLLPRPDSAIVHWEILPAATPVSAVDVTTTLYWQMRVALRPADFARRIRLASPGRGWRDGAGATPIETITDTLFFPELLGVLGDRTHEWRGAATEALGKLRHPLADAALRAAFIDPDPVVSGSAAVGLIRRGDRAALERVAAMLKGGDAERLAALELVRRAPDDRFLAAVVAATASPDETLRRTARGALVTFGSQRALGEQLAEAERTPEFREVLFTAWGDTLARRFGAASRDDSLRVQRVVVLELAGNRGRTGPAVTLAVRMRIGAAIPRLIDVLERAARTDWTEVAPLSRALVNLTGAPAPTDSRAQDFTTRTVAFWRGWRASAGASLRTAIAPASVPRAVRDDTLAHQTTAEELKGAMARWREHSAVVHAKQDSVARRLRRAQAGTGGLAALRP